MDRGAWQATVHGVTELDTTEQLSTCTHDAGRVAVAPTTGLATFVNPVMRQWLSLTSCFYWWRWSVFSHAAGNTGWWKERRLWNQIHIDPNLSFITLDRLLNFSESVFLALQWGSKTLVSGPLTLGYFILFFFFAGLLSQNKCPTVLFIK